MSEYLQGLLEKINREGVEKAQAEADRIIADAKAKAAAIVKDAEESAAKAKSDAEKASADYASRAADTIKQAARDTIRAVEDAIKAKLVSLLSENVDKALADPDVVLKLAKEAIAGLSGDAEVAVPAKLLESLKAQFAAQKNIKIVLDETIDAGFSVKQDGGRVENSFKSDVVAGELARRLRPDLAALLK